MHTLRSQLPVTVKPEAAKENEASKHFRRHQHEPNEMKKKKKITLVREVKDTPYGLLVGSDDG